MFLIIFRLFCVFTSLVLSFSIWSAPRSFFEGDLFFEESAKQGLQWAVRSQLSRKLVLGRPFFDSNRKDGLLHSLHSKTDLQISFPLDKGFRGFIFFPYERPVYASDRKIRNLCWSLFLCLGNIQAGLNWDIRPGGRFFSSWGFYLKAPSSRWAFKSSLLLGLGSSFRTQFFLLSKSALKLAFLTDHFLDLDIYKYRTVNVQKTIYNKPLAFLSRMGLWLSFPKAGILPDLYVFGDYQLSVSFSALFYHNVALNSSLSWRLWQKLQIHLGLAWGDRVFRIQNIFSADKVSFFDPNKTYMNLGFSLAF